MIKIFYKTVRDKQMAQYEQFRKNSWVYAEAPTAEEQERLVNEFGLDASLLQDAADPDEVPRYEIEDNILYIYTRFAYTNNNIIDTTPMLIAIKSDSIITVSQVPFPKLNNFQSGKIEFSTYLRNILLMKIFLQINDTYLGYLNNFSKRLRGFSMRFERIRNEDIVQFVNTENVLYDFNSSLVRMEAIYNNFLSGRVIKLTEQERDLLEDVYLANNQLIQITKENLRTMVNIREAYSTVMTNNLNRVIKLFTSLTVILTIPTIISSFYGMNVRLPFENAPLAFFGILALTLSIAIGALILFTRKDWL